MAKTNAVESTNSGAPAKVETPAVSIPRKTVQISVRGKKVNVPCVQVQGRTVIIKGTWLKIASEFDERAIDGDVIQDPEIFLRDLARAKWLPRPAPA